MRRTVLIVEDDPEISSLLNGYFGRHYNTMQAKSGAEALICFENHHIDLILLDIMLPVLDGWEVCRNVRARSQVPVIMLTAKTDEQSHLKGFELGVDDYVPKPFSPKVLLAKAQAIFKRMENQLGEQNEVYRFDDEFIIDEPAHKVTVNGEDVALSATEFNILMLFARNQGIVLTRDTILDRVWGENYFGDPRIVDTNMKRIRERLSDRAECIQTIRGVGYRFEVI